MGGKGLTKILLVEDDPDTLDLTAYMLRRERFFVLEANDGAQAIRRWQAHQPDLVIMDLGLPRGDGFDVIRRIRQEGSTPILVITGRKDVRDTLQCFDLGTDDFVRKPFDYRELIARVRAILRRARVVEEGPEPLIELDGLRLDPAAYGAMWRNECVRLTPTEFRILYLLITNAGHVVPASRLYTYVWGSDGADANALRTHISHLRRKLEIGGASPGTISSITAVGYVFRRAAQIHVADTIPIAVATARRIVAPQAGSAA